ncbi:MAG: type II secretion system protein [Oscillibacter sp.]
MKQPKTRRSRGFTLTETLAAVLILTLLTGVIAVGISAAVRAKTQLLFTSESDLLAATLNTALGDVLHYATEPVTEDKTVSFTNANYGVLHGQLLCDAESGKLYLQPSAAPGDRFTLVSDGAYTNLKVSDFQLAYADGLFTGSYTITGGDEQAKTIPFYFRPLNEASPAK